jgi:hypothetical protein
MEVIAHVVERHDDHYDAAKEIDGVDPRAPAGNFVRNIRHSSTSTARPDYDRREASALLRLRELRSPLPRSFQLPVAKRSIRALHDEALPFPDRRLPADKINVPFRWVMAPESSPRVRLL